jgi:PTH1 family peptidyl-tRNA hydrolase
MLSFIKRLLGYPDDEQENINEESDPMKYLIVGLGNPGSEYDETRHNVGFEVLDNLAKRYEVKFEQDSHGEICEFKFKGRTFILLKPNTFMNLSGKAVRYWLQNKKVQQENLLVVLDDLNLDLGNIRLRGKGSDGGHNGLKNIDLLLGNNKYPRLRVGIGDDFHNGRQVNYVLGKWTKKEWETLPDVLTHSAECVLAFGTIGIGRTMSNFNKKK